ncbi:MAG: NUDIX hydrolase [Patescibacteria group bacterium]
MIDIKLQVGVKIFLRNKEGKFLIVRRNLEKYKNIKGEWDIVGGRIDPGSKLIDNLKREVKEETQLEILSEPKLIYAQDIIPNEEKHVVRLSYLGDTDGEPILDTSENLEYKWLSLEELKNHDNLDVYVKEIISLGLIK